jgi:multisubunit Na+/H+ antiporter MnhG subunit
VLILAILYILHNKGKLSTMSVLICIYGILCHISDEELLKCGWPEDVWFHVDKVSSAHVYLRLRPVRSHTQTLRGI